ELEVFEHEKAIPIQGYTCVKTKEYHLFLQDKLATDNELLKKVKERVAIAGKNKKGNFYICKNSDEIEKTKKEILIKEKAEENTTIFIPQEPKYRLERVILSENTRIEIENAITLIKNQQKIYEEWGFNEIEQNPKLILNFYGPPGTGKTMVSHAIAHHLSKKILVVNYAEIESKFVGDSPKNLLLAFNTAKENDAVLFFDEADSFLGKRIESVSSSSDQAVNSLRSQMLILLEEFEGVIIFATNLAKNYDKAFESRILKHIHFDLPDKESREKIISITIPSKVPFYQVDKFNLCKKLANISEGFSGREIKNAVLEGLTIAAQRKDDFINETPFIEGFLNTKNKMDKLLEENKGKKLPESIRKTIIEKLRKGDYNAEKF
ncbi:ATP-binding protein, partial [Ornithobacterium rhinotracheale]|uniref:ATP-binding protein n=1 Tax=Ornithobacterium rhinotracheale TaxID=28251 RepID=UPI001FF5DC56